MQKSMFLLLLACFILFPLISNGEMVLMPEEELDKIAVKGGIGELERANLTESIKRRKTGDKQDNANNRASEIDDNDFMNANQAPLDNQISYQKVSPMAREFMDKSAAIIDKRSPDIKTQMMNLLNSLKNRN